MNSSIHSDLVLAYCEAEAVSLDVGFYSMANAAGMQACLWGSRLLLAFSWLTSLRLPPLPRSQAGA